MEHSPITAKAKALTDEKPPEDTPAMPIPPKPPHSVAHAKTATIIAPRQTTTAATLLVPSKQEKELPQQASRAPTFDHTTHNWPTLHPRNNPVSLLGDNRDIKATPPHVRAILWPYLRSTDNPRTVKTNSVATLERPRGRMQDRSSPRAWPHEAKELGPNKLPSPRSTNTQTPMTNPRSKNCILPPPNSQTQPTTVEEQRRAATPPDAHADPEQWQEWEHLRAFHASIPLWPTDSSAQGIEGGSPLIRTMLYPLSEATRISTYAWNGHWDTMSGTIGPNHPVTE